MRILELIGEMTMKGGNVDNLATTFGEKHKQAWLTTGTHIGDIENYKVVKDDSDRRTFYSVWDDKTLVAYTSLSDLGVVDDVWVNPNYRGKKIFSMLLWFYKTRLGYSKLTMGGYHSSDMQEVIKGLNKFNKSWQNIETGEVDKFDPNTVDNYYSLINTTPWRLILENPGNFSDWPMFAEGKSYIYESYALFVD